MKGMTKWILVFLSVSLIILSLSLLFKGKDENMQSKIDAGKKRTNFYYQNFPLKREDGYKVKRKIGIVSEGPIKLNEAFSVVRVQVGTAPDADMRSELGALISAQENVKVGDTVVLTVYEYWNNYLSTYTFVRIASKQQKEK